MSGATGNRSGRVMAMARGASAAQMAVMRMDWKSALRQPLDCAGFHYSDLCNLRRRLLEHGQACVEANGHSLSLRTDCLQALVECPSIMESASLVPVGAAKDQNLYS